MEGDPVARPAAALLAGGRSSRMGRDKATIDLGGRPMIGHVLHAVREAGCDPVVVVGGDRHALEALGVDVLDDLHPGEGPVGAILTALAAVTGTAGRPPASGVLVVPCDLPLLTGEALRPLVERCAAVGDAVDVVVAHTGRPEPLCAVWGPGARTVLQQHFDQGERAVHRVLASLRTVEVPVDPACLRNVNTPEELAAVRRIGSRA